LLEGKIMRGAQIKASELEKLGSDEDTGLYYAFAKDIKDNSLVSDLKPLKEIDKKLENIALKEGDLLLVMAMTETLKVACVEKLEGRKIIPASNIYIIRLDKSKILPTYFKMLLETEQAFKNFDAFASGTAIRAISVDYLNKLKIPLPALEVQNELVKKYRKIEDESESLKKRLAALAKEKGEVLASLF
jgi:restriction endonuclease S subunit